MSARATTVSVRPVGWSPDGRSHHVPGRYLISIPGLRRRNPLGVTVVSQVLRMPGARSARVSPLTGRLLVHYDPSATGPDDIDRLLVELLGPEFLPGLLRRAAEETPWHALDAREVCLRLETDPDAGLTPAEAADRLRRVGPNAIRTAPEPGLAERLGRQFLEPMALVLAGAAGLSALAGQVVDAVAMLGIVAAGAIIAALQEGRAMATLDGLERLAAPRCRAVRQGRVHAIPAEEAVPGDVITLEAGDRVPADLRLIEGTGLLVEEMALTGESTAVPKSPAPVPATAPLGDRSCCLYLGSHVLRGRGRGVVVATGASTQVGQIATLLAETSPGETPLQRRLHRLVTPLVRVSLLASAALAALGILRGMGVRSALLAGLSTAVAAIPEGLPVTLNVAMAASVRRMGRRHAVVRRLPALETLGNCQVICTDKTGTLTLGRMSLQAVYAGGTFWEADGPCGPDGAPLQLLPADRPPGEADRAALLHALRVAVLSSDAPFREGLPAVEGPVSAAREGDPTEFALVAAARALGLDPVREHTGHPRLGEWPFSPESRRMAVLRSGSDGERVLYVKGAPEEILPRVRWHRCGEELHPMAAHQREEVQVALRRMVRAGLRVLALADAPRTLPEGDLALAGLVGLSDAPRPEVPGALERCRAAGIRVMMLTGDHAETARHVATQLGILREGSRVLTGPEIDAMTEEELARVLLFTDVCARVIPQHKLRVVRLLRRLGLSVAMTGDGVNDAPALRAADTGIAMGRSGTDVTRAAADMVLLDDDFATLVAAVEEGRAAFQNIRRAVRYTLATNVGELVAMLGAALAGLPLPLSPIQLLWVNLVCDALPAVALAADRPALGLMTRPPLSPEESLLARGSSWPLVLRGALSGAGTLAAFALELARGAPVPAARTAALATLVLIKLLYLAGVRRDGREGGTPPPNWLLGASAGLSGLALAASVHAPGAEALFGTLPLSMAAWGRALGVALVQHGLGNVLEAQATRRAWQQGGVSG